MTEPPGNAAVAQLFDAYSRALVLYAGQWAGGAAEDVVQRVFERLLSGHHSPAEPRTWLFRCVRNEAISLGRSERRRTRRQRAVSADANAWFVSRPEDRIDAARVQAAMESLPADQREIVLLRVWSDLTLTEIAGITGLAVSTVHARYTAALDAMRQKLEKPCENPKT